MLERVRAIPPGFVRTYGDVSPGAPRYAGTVLHEVDEPELEVDATVRALPGESRVAGDQRVLEGWPG